jgi:hypothetical protein
VSPVKYEQGFYISEDDILHSHFFSFAGYGHIAPKTQWGKVVTIFYAILGIPMMLLCLSNIGDIMAQSFRFLYWRVCCYVCTKKPKRGLSRRGRSVRGSNRQTG